MAILHRSLFRVVVTRSTERFGVLGGFFKACQERDDLARAQLRFEKTTWLA